MEFFFVVVVIALISVGWAYLSLRQEMKKTHGEKHVKEDLAKGRVIFYSSSEDSPS